LRNCEDVPGDRLDISALYTEHGEALLVFLTRRTADPELGLDLWAETFAQAVTSQRRFRGRSRAEAAAWLYAIARRQLWQYYRRGSAERRAMKRLSLERPPADHLVEEALAQRAGLRGVRTELAAALSTLSEDTRMALALRVVEEMSFADVAKQLEISEPTARARVSRGLRALASILDTDTVMEASRP
jgi:RNA polymerase sigma-70 factor (ECF subfamily)